MSQCIVKKKTHPERCTNQRNLLPKKLSNELNKIIKWDPDRTAKTSVIKKGQQCSLCRMSIIKTLVDEFEKEFWCTANNQWLIISHSAQLRPLGLLLPHQYRMRRLYQGLILKPSDCKTYNLKSKAGIHGSHMPTSIKSSKTASLSFFWSSECSYRLGTCCVFFTPQSSLFRLCRRLTTYRYITNYRTKELSKTNDIRTRSILNNTKITVLHFVYA